MTKQEFLEKLDEMMLLPPGTLKGPEPLESLDQWTSVALIEFIALADTNNGVKISPRQLASCTTVADLLDLAKVS